MSMERRYALIGHVHDGGDTGGTDTTTTVVSTDLSVDITTSVVGSNTEYDLGVEFATNAETDAGAIANKAVQPAGGAYAYDRLRHPGQHAAGKGTAAIVLSIAASAVTADCEDSNVFRVVLTESITFNNPINPIEGQVCNVLFKQDATGGWVVTMGTKVKVVGTVSNAVSAVSLLSMQYDETDDLWYGVISYGFA